mgnify:CR=1 FL=1
MTVEDYLEKVRQLIAGYGHYVQYVGPDEEGHVGYCYTKGLSFARAEKFPELVMAGFDPRLMQQLLNDAAERMKEGDLRLRGPCFYGKLIQDMDAAFAPVNISTSSSLISLDEDTEVYFVFLPDANGLFPWDDGCDPAYKTQASGFDIAVTPRRDRLTAPRLH